MVGPVSPAERAAFTRKVKLGVAVLVGSSAGLVAVQAGASLAGVAGATLGGLAVGAAVAWYAVPSGPAPGDRRVRGPGNRDRVRSQDRARDRGPPGGTDGDADRRSDASESRPDGPSADRRRGE